MAYKILIDKSRTPKLVISRYPQGDNLITEIYKNGKLVDTKVDGNKVQFLFPADPWSTDDRDINGLCENVKVYSSEPESVPSCGEQSDISCPFCGEKAFDKPGLKYHLNVFCVPYMNTEEL